MATIRNAVRCANIASDTMTAESDHTSAADAGRLAMMISVADAVTLVASQQHRSRLSDL